MHMLFVLLSVFENLKTFSLVFIEIKEESRGVSTEHLNLLVRKRSSGFPTRSGTNRASQPQRIARGLKFWILFFVVNAS